MTITNLCNILIYAISAVKKLFMKLLPKYLKIVIFRDYKTLHYITDNIHYTDHVPTSHVSLLKLGTASSKDFCS